MEKFEFTIIHRLSQKLNNNTFYIKRDDLLPISFGGNKARKAVLFFEDLKNKGASCVVTYGSSSSNHCRIVANMAVFYGIPCYIISPIEADKTTSNSKLIHLFGARVTQCPVADVKVVIEQKIEELKAKGQNPYFIQGGGHGNIGTQAYVKAYQEILDYEQSKGVFFDYIFLATGTGTTQAGLICGNICNTNNRNIVGISIARKKPYGEQVVLDSVNEYLKSICRELVTKDAVNFVDDYVLDGYGSFNNEILQTIKEVLMQDGIPLDTTYTGKAFWGMKEYIKNKQIEGKNILFIHTGGTPLFFDILEELI